MKKIISTFVACMLCFTTVVSAKAEEMEIIEENIVTHSFYYVLTDEELENTVYEGKRVVYYDGEVYISDPQNQNEIKANKSILIYIGEILVGMLINGSLIYLTGYDGEHLTANAISSLVDAANELNESISKAFYKSYMSKVSRVVTRSGRDCVAAGGGLWRCTMADLEDFE